jgi:CRP-like cAMP-binding protein
MTTKREYFNAIKEIVADNEELTKFVEHELELLDKKTNSNSKKKTEKALADRVIMDEIVTVLNGRMTITEITKALDNKYSANKVSAMVKKLKDSGEVIRTEEKKVAYFEVA